MAIAEVYRDAGRAYVDAAGADIRVGFTTVRAVLTQGWQQVSSGAVRVSSRRPRVYVLFADLPSNANALLQPPEGGDEVEVSGRWFDVVDVRPDVENVGAELVLKAQEGE